LYVFLTK